MERIQADRSRVLDASPSKTPTKTPTKTPSQTPSQTDSQTPTPLPQPPRAAASPLTGKHPPARSSQHRAGGAPTSRTPARQPLSSAKHGRPMLISVMDDDMPASSAPSRKQNPPHAGVPPNANTNWKFQPQAHTPVYAHHTPPRHSTAAKHDPVMLFTPPRPSKAAQSRPQDIGPVELMAQQHAYVPPSFAPRPGGINLVGPLNARQSDAPEWEEPPSLAGSGGPQVSQEEKERLIRDLFESQDALDLDAPENQAEALARRAEVDGMCCTLMPHQVLGLDWLRSREAGAHKAGILADDMGLGKTIQMIALIMSNRREAKDPTIRFRPDPTGKLSSSKNAKSPNKQSIPEIDPMTLPRPTLVIAPLAVLQQWAGEFASKTNCGIRILVHHGKTKAKSAAQLAQQDVVVTTYDTCKAELAAYLRFHNTSSNDLESGKPKSDAAAKPKNKRLSKLPVARGSEDEWSSSAEESEDESEDELATPSERVRGTRRRGGPVSHTRGRGRGSIASTARRPRKAVASPYPLFELDWLRVVLDEAQNVKNHRTKGSEAVCLIGQRAEARWCLSGTPIQNNVMELYALLKFLRTPPFDDLKLFKEKIATPLQSTSQARVNWALKRLRTLQAPLLLRRTKHSELDGKKLIQLPPRHVHLVQFDFDDPAERTFYAGLEDQMRKVIDDGSEAQEGAQKIGHIQALVMLLRLRQACNHPALTMVKRDVDAEAVAPPPQPKAVGSQAESQGKSEEDRNVDEEADMLALALERMSVTKRCDLCNVLLPSDFDGLHCLKCKAQLEQANKKRDWQAPLVMSSKMAKLLETLGKIRDKIPVIPAEKDKSAITEEYKGQQEGFHHGNDTLPVQEARTQQDKTIVFSQFTSFLNLLEPVLQREGFKYVRYDGSMPPALREAALQTIRTDPNVNIILISFRSGSTGLNLTCCNHVVLMDLWWNPQLEEQAFDRAHRLGQQRHVYVYKLAIQGTVEQRLLEVQETKRQLADSALGGQKLKKGEGKTKLSWHELMYLFNMDA